MLLSYISHLYILGCTHILICIGINVPSSATKRMDRNFKSCYMSCFLNWMTGMKNMQRCFRSKALCSSNEVHVGQVTTVNLMWGSYVRPSKCVLESLGWMWLSDLIWNPYLTSYLLQDYIRRNYSSPTVRNIKIHATKAIKSNHCFWARCVKQT